MRFSLVLLTTAVTCISAVLGASAPQQPCQSSASPAHDITKEAFEMFKTAKTYMLGSLVNAEPTHTELQEASAWQLSQVKEKIGQASALNDRDTSFARREFYRVKLGWLKLEVNMATKMTAVGIPSWPWLGDAFNWVSTKWGNFVGAWNKFWAKTPAEAPTDQTPLQAAQAKQMATDMTQEISVVDSKIKELDAANVCSQK
jgi:hypothetical protein